MTDSISFPDPIQAVGPASPAQSPKVAGASGGKDFRSILLDSLNEVNRLQEEADQGVQRLLTGETNNVAEVITAVNKSGVAFDLLMEVRNKLSDAYREIQQMRV